MPLMEFAFALTLAAASQSPKHPAPPACVGETFAGWEACAAAAGEGTPAYALAMINLGTEAYVRADFSEALKFYDKAEAANVDVSSDVIFHAFRGDTYRRAGRLGPARADADIAWRYLNGDIPAGIETGDVRPIDDDVRSVVLGSILPIFQEGENPLFIPARDMFLALPAKDATALSNRAAMLLQIGEIVAAAAESKRAVELQSDDPGLLNNHCYILTQAGQADQGLWACERAVRELPEVAAVRHSYAAALANMGRCDSAERQLAEARRIDPAASLYRESLRCTPKG